MNLFSALQDPAATKMRQAVRLFAEALLELAAEPGASAEQSAGSPVDATIGEADVGNASADRQTSAKALLPEVRRLAGTMPAAQLAKQVGLSQTTLFRLAKEHAFSLAQPKGKQRKIDIAELRLLAPTMTRKELARHFDCDVTSVGEACSLHEIAYLPSRRGRRPKATKTVPVPKPRRVPSRTRRVTAVSEAIDAAPSTLTESGWVEGAAEAASVVEVHKPDAAVEPPVLEGITYTITTPDRSPPSPGLIEALQPVVEAAAVAMRAHVEPPAAPDGLRGKQGSVVIDEAAREDEAAGRAVAGFAPLPVERRRRAQSVTVTKPRLAPAAARGPIDAPSKWVRLQHPDGKRWLRMDGLGWVEKKADSFQVLRTKLDNVLKAFPLARECKVISEVAWSPKDILYAETVR